MTCTPKTFIRGLRPWAKANWYQIELAAALSAALAVGLGISWLLIELRRGNDFAWWLLITAACTGVYFAIRAFCRSVCEAGRE